MRKAKRSTGRSGQRKGGGLGIRVWIKLQDEALPTTSGARMVAVVRKEEGLPQTETADRPDQVDQEYLHRCPRTPESGMHFSPGHPIGL